MKLLTKLFLTAAALLLATTSADAGPRRPLFRRACVSPAPVRVVPAEPQRIPPPLVPVPVIPPPVVMPAVGVLTLPMRCVGPNCQGR